MDFENRHPEYASVADLVRRAQAERSVYVAHLIAEFLVRIGEGFKGFVDAVLEAERDWREMETESFAKHAAKRY
jgi:hypothetical protein